VSTNGHHGGNRFCYHRAQKGYLGRETGQKDPRHYWPRRFVFASTSEGVSTNCASNADFDDLEFILTFPTINCKTVTGSSETHDTYLCCLSEARFTTCCGHFYRHLPWEDSFKNG